MLLQHQREANWSDLKPRMQLYRKGKNRPSIVVVRVNSIEATLRWLPPFKECTHLVCSS